MGAALWRRRWVRRTLYSALVFVAGVNLAVSYFGKSDPFLLSPFHLWDKTRALAFYAVHQVKRLGAPEMPSPRHALIRSAEKHDVPRALALAIAKVESDFIPHRISRTGAMGIMQVMPDTAEAMGIRDPFHTAENADGGVRYLAVLWRRYQGDVRRVVAAYNAGPGSVPPVGNYRVPSETTRYVTRVVRYSRQFKSQTRPPSAQDPRKNKFPELR